MHSGACGGVWGRVGAYVGAYSFTSRVNLVTSSFVFSKFSSAARARSANSRNLAGSKESSWKGEEENVTITMHVRETR